MVRNNRMWHQEMPTEHAKVDPDRVKMDWIGPGEVLIPGSDTFKCLQKPA
jgi:hypothetical protein